MEQNEESLVIRDSILQIAKQKNEYIIRRGAAILALKANHDYGPPWPGSTKDCLLLPGAEKISALMGLRAGPPIVDKEIFDVEHGFFYLRLRIDLYDRLGGDCYASGMGSCNSYEDKYRYRNATPKCPDCGGPIFRSKFPSKASGIPGFYCNKNKGGCGAQIEAKDVKEEIGKVENPNPANDLNTIEMMAQKRAFIKAVRMASCVSDIFTQDAEDFTQGVTLEVVAEPKALKEAKDFVEKVKDKKPKGLEENADIPF